MPVHRNGQVAMVNRRVEKSVTLSNGKAYLFKSYNGVNLAWVDESDEYELARIKRRCCGHQQTNEFNYATDGEVAAWERGR